MFAMPSVPRLVCIFEQCACLACLVYDYFFSVYSLGDNCWGLVRETNPRPLAHACIGDIGHFCPLYSHEHAGWAVSLKWFIS